MSQALPEHLANSRPVVPGSNRTFGFVMAAALALLGLWPLFHARPVHGWLLGLALAFTLLALLRPALLAPLNRGWTWIGAQLHRVVSPVALGVVYALAILPFGLLMRLSGKDPMRRRFEPGLPSYWIRRDPPGRADAQMRKQF